SNLDGLNGSGQGRAVPRSNSLFCEREHDAEGEKRADWTVVLLRRLKLPPTRRFQRRKIKSRGHAMGDTSRCDAARRRDDGFNDDGTSDVVAYRRLAVNGTNVADLLWYLDRLGSIPLWADSP